MREWNSSTASWKGVLGQCEPAMPSLWINETRSWENIDVSPLFIAEQLALSIESHTLRLVWLHFLPLCSVVFLYVNTFNLSLPLCLSNSLFSLSGCIRIKEENSATKIAVKADSSKVSEQRGCGHRNYSLIVHCWYYCTFIITMLSGKWRVSALVFFVFHSQSFHYIFLSGALWPATQKLYETAFYRGTLQIQVTHCTRKYV